MRQFQAGSNFYITTAETPLRIVQFGSSACAPCFAIRNKLDKWVAQHKGVDSVYISVEDFPEVAAQEGVFAVPAVFVIADGRLTLRESGCFSLDELLARCEQYFSMLHSAE